MPFAHVSAADNGTYRVNNLSSQYVNILDLALLLNDVAGEIIALMLSVILKQAMSGITVGEVIGKIIKRSLNPNATSQPAFMLEVPVGCNTRYYHQYNGQGVTKLPRHLWHEMEIHAVDAGD